MNIRSRENEDTLQLVLQNSCVGTGRGYLFEWENLMEKFDENPLIYLKFRI